MTAMTAVAAFPLLTLLLIALCRTEEHLAHVEGPVEPVEVLPAEVLPVETAAGD